MLKISFRALRISNGYIVEDVAKQCGVSPSTIRKYEKDPSHLPLYLNLKLMVLYGIRPNSLIVPFN